MLALLFAARFSATTIWQIRRRVERKSHRALSRQSRNQIYLQSRVPRGAMVIVLNRITTVPEERDAHLSNEICCACHRRSLRL
jgi:hypothetical protein